MMQSRSTCVLGAFLSLSAYGQDTVQWQKPVGLVEDSVVRVADVVDEVEKWFVDGLRKEMEGPYGPVVYASQTFEGWVDAYLDFRAVGREVTGAQIIAARKRLEEDAVLIVQDRVQRRQKALIEKVGLQALVRQEMPRFLREKGLALLVKVLAEEKVRRPFSRNELRAHFARNAFRFGGRVKAAMIFFSFLDPATGKARPREERDSIRDQAFMVYRDVVNGADFAREASLHSDHAPSRKRGGDVGWFGFHGGPLPETVLEMAFKHHKGQVTQPVETRQGIYILKVLERRNRENPDFHKLRKEIEEDYLRELARRYIMRQRGVLRVERV